jgi:protein gp37
MAETTGIAWARSSFNPWIGCTKVSPGCDHCYAEALDARHKWGGATHWGVGVPRHRTSASLWTHPLKWDRACALERETGKVRVQDRDTWSRPGFWPVFPSLCDPFDNEVPREWFGDFMGLIRGAPNLTWLLLTKRIGNAKAMMPELAIFQNVWLGASIVNQEEADRDIPKLLATPVAKRFVSYEPALGPVDFRPWLRGQHHPKPWFPRLDQIIIGGESSQGGNKARPFDIEWARSTVRQCKAAGVAVFVKQIGSQPRNWCVNRLLSDPTDAIDYEPDFCDAYEAHESSRSCDRCAFLKDRAGADPAEWPEDLRVQEFPI